MELPGEPRVTHCPVSTHVHPPDQAETIMTVKHLNSLRTVSTYLIALNA